MSKIERVENRIRQIENRINRGPQIDSAAFNKLMAGHQSDARTAPPSGSPNAAMSKLNNMGHFNLASIQRGYDFSSGPGASVKPLAQSNSVSCGQTSVAMCLNSITGGNLKDTDIDSHYGFRLLEALKNESRSAGYDWKDAGNLSADSWSVIDRKVNQEKLPVIVALNGPEFSPSGYGHIVTIVKTEGDTVTYADPADGQLKTIPKQTMTNAPQHTDGNFVFIADKVAPDVPAVDPYAMQNNALTDDGML